MELPIVRRELVLPLDVDAAWAALSALDWLGEDVELDGLWEGAELRVDDRVGVLEEVVDGDRIRLRWWSEDGADDAEVTLRVVADPAGVRVVVSERLLAGAPRGWGAPLMALACAPV